MKGVGWFPPFHEPDHVCQASFGESQVRGYARAAKFQAAGSGGGAHHVNELGESNRVTADKAALRYGPGFAIADLFCEGFACSLLAVQEELNSEKCFPTAELDTRSPASPVDTDSALVYFPSLANTSIRLTDGANQYMTPQTD